MCALNLKIAMSMKQATTYADRMNHSHGYPTHTTAPLTLSVAHPPLQKLNVPANAKQAAGYVVAEGCGVLEFEWCGQGPSRRAKKR
jgi:hypothetical protein